MDMQTTVFRTITPRQMQRLEAAVNRVVVKREPAVFGMMRRYCRKCVVWSQHLPVAQSMPVEVEIAPHNEKLPLRVYRLGEPT